MNRVKCHLDRAQAWLTYLREHRDDEVPPTVAAEALRTALINAQGRAGTVHDREREIKKCLGEYYLISAKRRLEKIRRGAGESDAIAQEIQALRSDLARTVTYDNPTSLVDLGTDEDEMEFFLSSDPLKAE